MNHEYRKKPVIVDAFQMTEARRNDNADWPHWLNEAWNRAPSQAGAFFCERPVAETVEEMEHPRPETLIIHTLEGFHAVTYGDFIIRGVHGELYPCKPDIFAATYEPVVHE